MFFLFAICIKSATELTATFTYVLNFSFYAILCAMSCLRLLFPRIHHCNSSCVCQLDHQTEMMIIIIPNKQLFYYFSLQRVDHALRAHVRRSVEELGLSRPVFRGYPLEPNLLAGEVNP